MDKKAKMVEVNKNSRRIEPHIANLIYENLKDITPDWWREVRELLNSKSPQDRKFAISEINKIQLKMMPTALALNTDNDDTGVIINIVNYSKKDNQNGDTTASQIHSKSIPGTIVGGDGPGN